MVLLNILRHVDCKALNSGAQIKKRIFVQFAGIPQVVLLTKIDRVSQRLIKDVSKTFLVPKIGELVDKAADIFGLPRANIIPIKNYEDEMELREDVNTLALLAMQQILNFADDYLANFLED